MKLYKKIPEAAIGKPPFFAALIAGAFVCFAYSPSAYAQCPVGKVEVQVTTPSGITRILCLPGEAVENIEDTPDHGGGDITVVLRSGFFDFNDLTPNVDVPSTLSSGNVTVSITPLDSNRGSWEGAESSQSIGSSALRLTPTIGQFAGFLAVDASDLGLLVSGPKRVE